MVSGPGVTPVSPRWRRCGNCQAA